MMTFLSEAKEFVVFFFRPRAIKWWWRLGAFECSMFMYDFYILQRAAHKERYDHIPF
jgi:hypothetical protein